MAVTRSHVAVSVAEPSGVAGARRCAARMCRELGWDDVRAGNVAIVATELATNLVRHARGGLLVIQTFGHPGPGNGGPGAGDDSAEPRAGVELIAIDRGPGIPDLRRAVIDGFSTATPPTPGAAAGTGLGAVQRLSDVFDGTSRPGVGTVLLARMYAPAPGGSPRRARALAPGADPPRAALAVDGVCVPFPGLDVCGDAWDWYARPGGVAVMIVDGLGHGPGAAEAARRAVDAFRAARDVSSPADALAAVHDATRGSRGAAGAIAWIEPDEGRLRCAGVGNVCGRIITGGARQLMVWPFGTLGVDIRPPAETRYAWRRRSTLVMHTDGVGSRWRLTDYPELIGRHPGAVPGLIAAVLIRDHRRPRDDATAVVIRRGKP